MVHSSGLQLILQASVFVCYKARLRKENRGIYYQREGPLTFVAGRGNFAEGKIEEGADPVGTDKQQSEHCYC